MLREAKHIQVHFPLYMFNFVLICHTSYKLVLASTVSSLLPRSRPAPPQKKVPHDRPRVTSAHFQHQTDAIASKRETRTDFHIIHRQQASAPPLWGVSCGAMAFSYRERTSPHTFHTNCSVRIDIPTYLDDLLASVSIIS